MQKPESGGNGMWAATTNVLLASGAIERAMNRAPNLPGLVAFCGPSGYGKSMAAAYCANKCQGFYVECRSFFTKKVLADAVVRSMGIRAGRTLSELIDQIAEQLILSGRPLLLDEMDHIVDKNAVEIVRDIHEAARGSTVFMIGEEQFPKKLSRWERFHNRVLIWEYAQPATDDDVRKLARFYCPGLDLADDLLKAIRAASRGAARRICVNLDRVRAESAGLGWKKVDLATWGNRGFYTGDAPTRRLAA